MGCDAAVPPPWSARLAACAVRRRIARLTAATSRGRGPALQSSRAGDRFAFALISLALDEVDATEVPDRHVRPGLPDKRVITDVCASPANRRSPSRQRNRPTLSYRVMPSSPKCSLTARNSDVKAVAGLSASFQCWH